MIVDATIPIHGLTITEAKLVRWHKQPGERVEKGEALLEMETDKAVEAVESPAAGWVLAHLAREGDVVPLGRTVARIGTEATDRLPASASGPVVAAVNETGRARAPASRARENIARAPLSGAAKASPRARRAAKRLGVELSAVTGTGRGGLHIRERDVLYAASSRDPRDRVRQVTARRMAESFREAPHFYLTREVCAERVWAFRESLLASPPDGSPRITFTDLFLRALALALREHPAMNARWTDQGPTLQSSVDIGLAVDTDRGLVAPVLRGADPLSLAQIATARFNIVERARRGELAARDLVGGGFTLSNLGRLGVDQFQAIINPPQCGILAVGAIRPRPFAADGRLIVAKTVFLTLSADHRMADGAIAARLLGRIAELVEEPEQLG